MTTETTVEMKSCSGCRMPGCMVRRLIPMQHGYICEVCEIRASAACPAGRDAGTASMCGGANAPEQNTAAQCGEG